MKTRKLTNEQAITAHYKIVSSNLTQKELCEELNINPVTMLDIKFCRNNYQFLQDQYGIKPPEKVGNKISDEVAINVYNLSKLGYKAAQIKEMTGVSINAINDIKFCKNAFNFLTERYNLEPQERIKKREITNYFPDEARVLDVYYFLKNDKCSAAEAAQIFGCPKTIITDIKMCRGNFCFLKTKYNLEPLIGRTDL